MNLAADGGRHDAEFRGDRSLDSQLDHGDLQRADPASTISFTLTGSSGNVVNGH